MCLVVLAFRVSADAPLIVAANRDEFHGRPTQNAGWWPDAPDIFAGRDLQAGGTWLGVHRSGRFATVTNFRDARPPSGNHESRGRLVADFLLGSDVPAGYLGGIDADAFAGFNLLVSDGETLGYLSNRGGGLRQLPPGIYGLSNATLDSSWEKVERSKTLLAEFIDSQRLDDESLFELLGDRNKGPREEVRDNHLPFATAHAITAPFIVTPDYGTRCSTIVRTDNAGGWQFVERRFSATGEKTGESQFSIGGAED